MSFIYWVRKQASPYRTTRRRREGVWKLPTSLVRPLRSSFGDRQQGNYQNPAPSAFGAKLRASQSYTSSLAPGRLLLHRTHHLASRCYNGIHGSTWPFSLVKGTVPASSYVSGCLVPGCPTTPLIETSWTVLSANRSCSYRFSSHWFNVATRPPSWGSQHLGRTLHPAHPLPISLASFSLCSVPGKTA
jgi:hypothetical protein